MNTAMMAWAGLFNPANIGMPELVVVLVIVLLVFGPKKLPALGKSIGKSLREFKEGMKGLKTSIEEEVKDIPKDIADLDPKPAASSEEKS